MNTEPPRPAASSDIRLALRAATMYHLEGATQSEIAAKLGVSRPTAGRLIARARAQGLVRIEIGVPDEMRADVHTDLERDLERVFGLTEAIVVGEVPTEVTAESFRGIGVAAATLLARRLQPGDTLGFTWGPETVAVARALRPGAARCAAVVQLDGSLSSADYQTGVDYTLGTCAERLGAKPIRLHAPLYADPDTVTAMERDSVLGKAIDAGRGADLMMFGIGPVSTSTTLFEGSFIDTAVLDELHSLDAVGEMGGRFYRRDGADVVGSLPPRTISVPLDAVRACPTTVLVTGGTLKHEAMLGALNGGLAKELVTDVDSARWLLEQKEESSR